MIDETRPLYAQITSRLSDSLPSRSDLIDKNGLSPPAALDLSQLSSSVTKSCDHEATILAAEEDVL